MSDRVYLSPPEMNGSEFDLVGEAFASNWLAPIGPFVDEFERSMEAIVGRPCVAVSSGTAAIHLALRLIGVEQGDEVICPSLTFVGSANPILYLGAHPVFVDSESMSWNLDPGLLDAALRDRRLKGRKVKAVIVVHLYGQTADMVAIGEVCQRHGVAVVEDAAEALGARHYELGPAGALAPLGVFSFNGNKIITTSGGGMLVCDSREAAVRARGWAAQARLPAREYLHEEVGYNYRMSNVLAAMGVGQLRTLEQRVERRREIFASYVKAFARHPLVAMPEAAHGRHTRWLSTFLAPSEAIRDAILDEAEAQAIEARPAWRPMHLQPLFADAPMYGGDVSRDIFSRGLCLPSGGAMTSGAQQRVIDAVISALGAK